MFDVIAIGASAGGIQTCRILLAQLPEQFSWPILLVQHIGASQDAFSISRILARETNIPVVAAKEGDNISPHRIYIAPSGYHMLVTKKKTLHLSNAEKVMFSRPSIDVLFKSIAEVFQNRAIGIILTGASPDGAEGLATIKSHGGFTIVQNPATAVMRCMPDSALAQVDSDTILPPIEIGQFLKEMWLLAHPLDGRKREKNIVTE
jgi:two-component system chemotaxis response regulator CheB